jgi:multidrug efflux pump subunit AcrA (membrane-fusion protein)
MKAMFGVILVGASIAIAGCAKHEAPPETVRPVVLAQVVAGSGAETAVFAGEVKPRFESDLAFRIPGKIVARMVDSGARVSKGQMLARLDQAGRGPQAQAAQAQAAAQTEFDFARAEFQRYQTLLEQKFISASALDAKRNDELESREARQRRPILR